MAVQAQWHTMTWKMDSSEVRQLESFSTSRELDVEKNEDSEGQPPTQDVRLKLRPLDFSYTVSPVAGIDPKEEYEKWDAIIAEGIHAPFYLEGSQFGDCDFLLNKIALEAVKINPEGKITEGKISLTFEEYAEEESGKKADKGKSTKLTPGISEYYDGDLDSALRVTADEDERAREG